MKTACVVTGRGQGNVHGNSERLGIFGGIESPAGFPEHLLQLGLCLVNHLSERRTILLRQGTDAFHYGGQRTIAAKNGSFQLIELRSAFNRGKRGFGFREDGLQLILHGVSTPVDSTGAKLQAAKAVLALPINSLKTSGSWKA